MDLTKIVSLVITLIFALISTFVVPYIKAKISAEKLDQIKAWVKIAVQAAEMIYKETGMGKEKKNYVLNFLNEKGIMLDYDSINNLIESAVLELKLEL